MAPAQIDHYWDAAGRFWVIAPLGEDWRAAYRIAEQAGELVVAELRVSPTPQTLAHKRWHALTLEPPKPRKGLPRAEPDVPRGGLTVRRLRKSLSFTAVFDHARAQLKSIVQSWHPDIDKPILPGALFSEKSLDATRRVGRPAFPDHYYAEVAALYVAACDRGSGHPVVDVAKELLGERGVTRARKNAAYVRDVLNRARQRGLLTRPSPGRASGQLTDKALAALGEKSKKEKS